MDGQESLYLNIICKIQTFFQAISFLQNVVHGK